MLLRGRLGFTKVEATLKEHQFAEEAWKVCLVQESIPWFTLKMQMVGFLEDLPSQRATSSQCDDSRDIRELLGYDLT